MDTLPINFAILAPDGTIWWTNSAWREFGVANDIAMRPDTLGVNYLDVTEAADDEYAQAVGSGLSAVLSGAKDEFELEYPCHSPEKERWFLLRATAFTAGEDRYAAVAHIDITARVKRERESDLFRRVVETASQAVFITETDGEITYVNPAFEDVTGYSAGEAIGKTPRILKSGEHDPEFFEELWTTILAGEKWDGLVINRRKSGGLYYAHQTISPIMSDSGDVHQFVALQTEVTDIEEMKQQLQAHDDILRHELRTQLSVIQGHTEHIDGEPNHTDAILRATEQLLSTAEKTRDLRKFLERTTDPEPLDIVPVVTDVVAHQRERFPDASLTCDTPDDAVALGVHEMRRALTELTENSITHSDQTHPQVTVAVRKTEDAVEISITDDGPGIPQIEYETFDETVPTQLNHRSGLGLDIAYWITRRSGGQLQIADRDSQGSVVTIILPKKVTGR